ncbi:MAG: hypothetical protein ABW140_12935 [Candidatus Sedimenticola sp. 6PFRAG1]
MKSQLLYLIQVVIDLLVDCGWEDKAGWFSEYKDKLEGAEQGSNQFYELLNELDGVLSGIGSFSDLPLRDKTGRRSEQEVRNIQWDLAEKLGDSVERIRKS